MGFIQAFTGALTKTFADEWKEFYVPRQNTSETAVVFHPVKQTTNAGVGQNTKGFDDIISNGSKIVVPEGTALLTIENGEITGFISEPGGYVFHSDDPNSKSFLGGGGILSSTLKSSWEKFKFGGIPGAQQQLIYVNLKEIPNNRFGTQTSIYWDDAFLQTQVGAIARGTYSIKITDPILFVKNFVPAKFLQPSGPDFDFNDEESDASNQLFSEVVGCLSQALSIYTNDPQQGNRITRIQQDTVGFAKAMSLAVEQQYQWKSNRGIEIVNANAIVEYDEKSRALVDKANEADLELRATTRLGQAYANNMAGMMAADTGAAMKQAAGNENGSMMGFMGLGMAQAQGANVLGTVGAMPQAQPVQPQQAQPAVDPYQKLTELKKLLDDGVITQEDFDAAKKNLLGI